VNSLAPRLFATPQTASEVAAARAVVVLIGGYDGSGNYGDLLQFDATTGMLARFDPQILLLPVLERSRLADHRAVEGDLLHPPPRALFFDPGDAGQQDDRLVPVPAPAEPAFAAFYLYGGGYLNPSWGARKLAMLHAAEDLLLTDAAVRVCRLSSGLQASPEWIAELEPASRERLRSFELLGARDPVSAEALEALGSGGAILDTGDDSIGVLRNLDPPAAREDDDRVRLNVHIAGHPWVTERPEAIADFYADFMEELGRCSGRQVIAQPLIAYRDRYVEEGPMVERLRATCATRGVPVAEPPLLLRPVGLADSMAAMRGAVLTLSCSYHVALTSLLLGVPAALLSDNGYYEQKAAGLTDAFDLAASFAVSTRADPRARARELATVVLDPGLDSPLRRELAFGAARMGERRAAAEAELLARLGSGAATALADTLGDASARLRERSAEPAELLARLAALESEGAASLPGGAGYDEDGEVEARLQELLASRSWRMTEPLRRIGARLRRS
jgi:polysaccharide pyruvyl transferase